MRLLLDTVSFLWLALDDASASAAARDAFRDPDNDVYLSAVSAWEIGIKYSIGKLLLPDPPERLVPALRRQLQVAELPLSEEAALGASKLPRIHGDPFDRALVGQAIAHGLVLVTPDEAIRVYPVQTLW